MAVILNICHLTRSVITCHNIFHMRLYIRMNTSIHKPFPLKTAIRIVRGNLKCGVCGLNIKHAIKKAIKKIVETFYRVLLS